MEIRRLLYFARIAEDGSLTRAAGVLRIAQPALSRQLRLLEEELGVSLFTRTPRGMRLTEEGEYLHETTAGPLRALEFALQNVRSLASGTHGSLVIGLPNNLVEVLATRFVLRMRSDFPDIRLRVIEGATGSLMDWLNRGIIDCALLEGTSGDERLTDIALFSEPLMAVGGPASDLDPARPITPDALLRLPLILPSHHLGIRATVDRVAAKARIALAPAMEMDSTRLILDLVEHGEGYTILPRLLYAERCLSGRVNSAPVAASGLDYALFLSAKRRERAGNQRVAGAVLSTLRALLAGLAQ